MAEIKVPVPDDRVPEFYQFFGAWLAGATDSVASTGHQVGNPEADVASWAKTDEDLALARVVWKKLSDRAQGMLGLLLEHPGSKISGEKIAEELNIPHGKYGVAGVLAWPGRHCYAVGRHLPVLYEDGPVGGSANYWIEKDVADVFKEARASS